MALKNNQEIYNIKQELNDVISELEDISNGISRDFSGIGNEKCSRSIEATTRICRQALSKLNNIDTSKVAEGFGESDESGGGSESW